MVILISKKRSKFRIKTIILTGENFWSKFSVESFGRNFKSKFLIEFSVKMLNFLNLLFHMKNVSCGSAFLTVYNQV